MLIRELTAADYERVREIFMQGVRGCLATFATSAPEWVAWDAAHLKEHRLAAAENGVVVGWTALTPHGGSCAAAYRGVAEISLYIDEAFRGRGAGRELLEAAVESSERGGLWTLEAVIVAENAASRRLFEGAGFREVGYRERIGRTPDGAWHDTVIYERRSKTVEAG